MISGFQTEMIRANVELCEAVVVLRNGGTVAFPTETVCGLGASALDPNAVARIFEIKQRPRFDPLIVHVWSLAQGRQVVREWPDAARELSRRFWPGPLTFSASGNLQEAAANLFAALSRLDALGLDRIVTVKVPDIGVGLAIDDRLRRAAHKPSDAVRGAAT